MASILKAPQSKVDAATAEHIASLQAQIAAQGLRIQECTAREKDLKARLEAAETRLGTATAALQQITSIAQGTGGMQEEMLSYEDLLQRWESRLK